MKRELNSLNKQLQEENEARVTRMKEYKRKQILETQLELQKRNEKRKIEREIYDCNLRKQAVDKHEAKAKIYEMLDKLMKSDISKSEAKSILIGKLKEWNDKFGLKMVFHADDEQPNISKIINN